jgi:hypothetical protein
LCIKKKDKKIVHLTKKSYIWLLFNQLNTMNNLVRNYKIILKELTKTCSHIERFSQVRQPKLSNLELSALNITAEYMSYNSENHLFRIIRGTEFDGKISRVLFQNRLTGSNDN